MHVGLKIVPVFNTGWREHLNGGRRRRVVSKDRSNRSYPPSADKILDSQLGVSFRVLIRYADLALVANRLSSFFSLGRLPDLEAPDFINTSQFLGCPAVKLKRHFATMFSMLPVSTFLVLCLMTLGPVHAQNTTLPPIVVPTPPGPYATRMEVKVIVDTSHPDPYNSTLKYNRILTSIYTPVSKSLCLKFCEEQYYPPATAAFADETLDAHGIFERLTLSLCCSINPSPGRIFHDDKYPVLILTPGLRESRLDFSVFAQYLSSYGYKVILMEQPGEPNIVEFPDGEIVRSVFGIAPTDADEVLALNVQVQDILFIIDQFTKGKEITEQVNYIGRLEANSQ